MKVLVTGGAGFIGSCLLWKLNKNGIEDIIVVDVNKKAGGYGNLSGKKFENYINREELLNHLRQGKLRESVDMIIHFGACTDTTERNAEFLKRNNLLYSKELAEWSYKNNKKFIYASSASTYGAGELGYSDDDKLVPKLNPLNEYGRSKQAFDIWVLENKLQNEFTGFKFFNVYGPNEYHKEDMRSMVNKGYHQIKERGKIRLFKSYKPEYKDGGQKRDFIYVKDALDIIWFFIEHPEKSGIYNVGTGDAKTWNELAEAIFLALKLKTKIEYIEMPENIKNQYQYFTQAELSKLKNAGYKSLFTNLKDAVKDYVSYLEKEDYL